MSTFDDLVTRLQSRLRGVARDRVNTLDGSISSSAITFDLSFTPDGALTAGTVIEIDNELMYVLDVTASTLTVIRGWDGTTAAGHANDALVTIEPRFPRHHTFEALVDEARALPANLFRVETVQVTFPAETAVIELDVAEDVYRVLSAWRTTQSNQHLRVADLQLLRNANPAVYPSGFALALGPGAVYRTSIDLWVSLAVPLDVTGLVITSEVTDTGLDERAEDILVYGAGASLLLEAEALRLATVAQGQSRDADEVPPDALGKLGARWRSEAERRTGAEAQRLLEYYPWTGR